MTSPKPLASLSLDLDNKWTYLKTHGDPGWESFPSYLELLVPRVLEFFAERELKVTFFVVGQDAALPRNQSTLQSIAAAGHEIGNHSFAHEPWLHLYNREQLAGDIAAAEEQIVRFTGQRPVGFRGPGFSFSETAFEILQQRGYLYDASTLPMYLGPLARLYCFLNSDLDEEERRRRAQLFGTLKDGLRPLKPYRWHAEQGLLEMPVTTMPVVRTPIHVSYLLYLSSYSPAAAMAYFRAALQLCRLMRVAPSLLLHPLDFLGQDDRVGLDFFPAMNLPAARKIHFVSEVLKAYAASFRVVSLREHAHYVSGLSRVRVIRVPELSPSVPGPGW